MTMSLPHLPEIQQLSSRVIRILGCNPSNYTLQGTNSYLIGQGSQRLLIDTSSPEQPAQSYCVNLKKVLQEQCASINTILLTHWHHDHIGAVKNIIQLSENLGFKEPIIKKFISKTNPHEAPLSEVSVGTLLDSEQFQPDSATTLSVLYLPGHTDDHACMLLKEEHALFTGDLILGHGSGVFQDLSSFMTSLEKCKSIAPKVIYPGHGAHCTTADMKIQENIDHRVTRINQVKEGLMKAGATGATETQLVKQIYPPLPADLYHGALRNLYLALLYLEDRGLARRLHGNHGDAEESIWVSQSESKL